jgi:dihydrofolate synthase / folylpolyglutamate synthase
VRTLAEWLEQHESLHPKTIDMELGRVTRVARALGVEEPGWPVITVAGTNGKGSTAAHIAALLGGAGARTGLFTSPHFLRYNERIAVDGEEVGDPELIDAFERIEAARQGTTLTYFEHNTLAALLVFRRRAVDAAVLEVGLGGRLDATNLVAAAVAVIASVGFDHRDWLGETLEQIGAEKAGIVRPGRPVVLGTPDMPASVGAVIRRVGARPLVAGQDFTWQVQEAGSWSYTGPGLAFSDLPASALAGSIQYRNAAMAITACQALLSGGALPGHALSQPAVARALAGVKLPGRFQVVPGEVEWILDIAHNEPAAQIFARHVRERPLPQPAGRTFAVVGILGDKDAGAIADITGPLVDRWFLCALPGPRGVPAEELARRMRLPAERVILAPSVESGCQLAREAAQPGDRVLVFGSVGTVGPALRWLGLA